jgi:hypothetical protein
MATTHRATTNTTTRPRAPGRPPDLTIFTVVHRAMRRDAARLAGAVTGLGDGDAARARALQRWYRGFRAELAEHHTIEDDLFFPVLAERVPTFAQHTDRIDREHHLLDDALSGVGVALDGLVHAGGSSAARGPARDATCELTDMLDAHLGFEDADVLPLYLRHFTEDEYGEVGRRASRMVDKRNLGFTVPWVVGAATPAERDRLFEQAPLAFKLLWYASRRRHARVSTRALGATTEPGVA